MTLTILFDLDDTLLNTNMPDFIPAYFTGLGQALSDLASPKKIAQQVQFAVSQMQENRDPAELLHTVFAKNFYPQLGTTEQENLETLARYYAEDYPKLSSLTGKIPEVTALINWCKAQGAKLAIATNPLFPETATRQRIDWSGLELKDFEFFSTYDNFHFTKPNLTYYAECLGRLGWPEDHIVMIGDSLNLDLLPMETLGFPTFWINPSEDNPIRPHGALGEVKAWLSDLSNKKPATFNNTPEVNFSILQSTPAVFDSWIKENTDPAFEIKPSPDEWNLTEVLWHVADMEEEVYLPQWQQLLVNPSALLTVPDTSRWAAERDYTSRPITDAWEKFVAGRKNSLMCINEIMEKDLCQTIIQHTIFSHATVGELVAFTARHDRIHLQQSKALLDFYKIY